MLFLKPSQFCVDRVLTIIAITLFHILEGEDIRQPIIPVDGLLVMLLIRNLHIVVHIAEILLSHHAEEPLLGSKLYSSYQFAELPVGIIRLIIPLPVCY